MFLTKIGILKLKIISEKASASPPVGPTLGQAGLNIMDFCKDFNKKSAIYKEGLQLNVKIKIYENKNFNYVINTPTIASYIKSLSKLNSSINILTLKQIYHLAILKRRDKLLIHLPLKSICSMIIGTAKSMNIKIILK